MQQNQSQNPMAVEPVPKLMARIGLPIVLSMILQAAYNVVDSAYLARMAAGGETALTALSLAFPVQLFMVAVSIGTGVGTNALLARLLGLGDKDRADAAVGNAQFLALVISAVFMLFSAVGVVPYVNSQSAGGSISGEVLSEAIDYLHICCGIPFGIVFFSVYEKTLQATGRSLWSTVAQISGALVNIMLDPFLIYGWCGLPQMGVRGAAVATVVGQLVSMALGLAFHLKLNVELDSSLRYWKPRWDVIRSIYAIGLPAIISQALLTVMTYSLNLILAVMPDVGQNAVTVYGLYYKIQQLIIFAAFGVRDAITPVVAFNYGLRSRARVQQGIRWGLGYTAGLCRSGIIRPAVGRAVLAVRYHSRHVCGLHAHRLAGLLVCGAVHRIPGGVPGIGVRRRVAGHLAVPPGVVCAAAGLGADPAGDRPGECLPRLVAAGPGRSRHTGSGAGAVPEAGEKTDRFLKKAARGTTSDGFCIG